MTPQYEPTIPLSEDAAAQGMNLANIVKAARLGGATGQTVLQEVIQLANAPGRDALDALAFLSIARKLLESGIQDVETEVAFNEAQRGMMHFTAFLITRAIDALQAQTGVAAETFTGDGGTIN